MYARTIDGGLNLSVSLSTGHSNARSYLSNLSLADVSNISVLSLPITTAEIWNLHLYTKDHNRTTKAHASAQESRFAMAQSDSVFQSKVEAKMTLDKIQNAGNTRDQRSSCMPDKIMLLGTLRIYLNPVLLRESHWLNTTLAQVSHLLERPRYSDNYRISMRAALLPMTVWKLMQRSLAVFSAAFKEPGLESDT